MMLERQAHRSKVRGLLVVLCLAGFFAMMASPAFAQVKLSGMTLWDTRDSNGSWSAGPTYYYFNTLGSGSESVPTVANVYLFTGAIRSAASPINGGNTNSSLNPNRILSVGANVLFFASHTTPPGVAGSSSFGINLFFDDDLTNNRISAKVRNNGTNDFSVIDGATNTYGETRWDGPSIPGAGSLSYSTGGYLVVLTNFYVLAPEDLNLVGYYDNSPAGGPQDTNGSITLTVTAIPEPSTYAALAGLAALCFAAYCRRRQQAG